MTMLGCGRLLVQVPSFTNHMGRGDTKGARDGQGKKSSRAVVEQVQPYRERVAKSLIDRIYGPAGLPWGTKLTELEVVVIAVRQVLSETMHAQALQRQAQAAARRSEAFQQCSGCARPVAVEPAPKPRHVQTRAGDAAWTEPHGYCRPCRQAFVPSEPESGP